MGQAIKKGERHGAPLRRFECLEATVQGGAILARGKQRKRVGVLVRDIGGLGGMILPMIPSEHIDRAITKQGEQPSLRRAAARIETRRALPNLQQCIMDRVRGELRLPGQTQGKAVETAGFQIVQLPEGDAVSRAAADEERLQRIIGLPGNGNQTHGQGGLLQRANAKRDDPPQESSLIDLKTDYAPKTLRKALSARVC
jgi:hypothetical protein